MSTPRRPAANLGMASTPGPNNGLLVQKVDRNGSAASGGVLVGDEVVAIDGKPTPRAEVVPPILADAGGVGAVVTVSVIRDRAVVELPVTLVKKTLSLEVEDVSEVLER